MPQTKKKTKAENLLELPIDQYGRYYEVSEIIKKLAKKSGHKGKLKILDVGGYKGEIHKFFNANEAEITILDLPEANAPNYIQGSALDMPFEDDAFDYIVTFEVFEHIPRPDRAKFIQELVRVSAGQVILTAPFAGEKGEVLTSEKLVNEFWKSMYGQNHRWLIEHIENVTPKRSELEAILTKQKLNYAFFGNNDLVLWNLMVSFNYLTTLYRSSGLNPEIQEFYNLNRNVIENPDNGYYRYIYVINTGKLAQKDFMPSLIVNDKRSRPEITAELINKLFISIAHEYQKSLAARERENRKLARQLKQRIEMHDNLVEEINRLNSERKASGKLVNGIKQVASKAKKLRKD